MSDEVKFAPCPFCRYGEVALSGIEDDAFIHCRDCGARGPDAENNDRDKATLNWNGAALRARHAKAVELVHDLAVMLEASVKLNSAYRFGIPAHANVLDTLVARAALQDRLDAFLSEEDKAT